MTKAQHSIPLGRALVGATVAFAAAFAFGWLAAHHIAQSAPVVPGVPSGEVGSGLPASSTPAPQPPAGER